MSKIALSMSRISLLFVGIILSVFITSCGDDTPQHADTLGKGAIDISVDESFQPVMEDQLKVFDSIYPDAKITVHYKPEAECFKDYFAHTAHLIIVTRDLTKQEKDQCDQEKIFPSSEALASDGIAVIVNNASQDTILDMDALTGILTGVYKKRYTAVFDNQGSSTLRYLTDSVLHGAKLAGNVFAAKNSKDVIDYVSKNSDAIGFVGMGYVYANEDTSTAGTFINTVKVVAMQNPKAKTIQFNKPYQAYVALRSYPLTRKLFYINAESYHGLGTGFANFLGSHNGQLLFLHEHFFPLKEQIVIREADIRQ
jgi:phosphate transport system substrate-binding protein